MNKLSGAIIFSVFTLLSVNAQEEGTIEPIDTVTSVDSVTNMDSVESVDSVTNSDIAEVKGALEGLNESYSETKGIVEGLKRLKISGYVQAQYQATDMDGAKTTFSGGDFPAGVHSRFTVRRGRIKFNYDNTNTQYVLQIDATERGLGLKDAYISFEEPWTGAISLTAGIFNRPFGFEISYSSSSRETPERSRLFQTLFPGERDLGVAIEIAPQIGIFSFLNLKGGLFTGNGVASETDNHKDFIGRIGFSFPFENINLAIDGGVSGYFGKVRLDNSVTVSSRELLDTVINGKLQYRNITKTNEYMAYKMDASAGQIETGKDFNRTYIGGDLQLYYDFLGGLSLRAEYIQGKQPGNASSSSAYRAGNGDLYLRNFSGYYINYIQNIGIRNQFIAKYDVYDPNIDVEGSNIGIANSKLSAADIKYSTLGLGWIFHWDSNIKFVTYYEIVKNEKVNSSAIGSLVNFKEDVKDNVFTFRIQYKF